MRISLEAVGDGRNVEDGLEVAAVCGAHEVLQALDFLIDFVVFDLAAIKVEQAVK
jgi:hypothetical protein